MLKKTNSVIFVLLLCMHMCYQHALPSTYWRVKRDWKGKELWIPPSFPSALCHRFQHNWLTIQRSKGDMIRVCWSFGFLLGLNRRNPNSSLSRKRGLCGLLEHLLLQLLHSVLDATYLLYICFEFCWTPIPCGFIRISHSWGTANTVCRWGSWEEWESLRPP